MRTKAKNELGLMMSWNVTDMVMGAGMMRYAQRSRVVGKERKW